MNAFSKTQSLGFAVLIALLLSAGCQISGTQTNNTNSVFIFSAIDVSGTTAGERSAYASDFSKILDQMKGGDTLWADVITESSLATARIPIKAEFAPYSAFTSNEDDYPKQLVAQKAALNEKLAQWITTQKTPRTTILDAMLLAQKVLRGEKATAASRRVLVIFSDMLEDDGQYRFDCMNLSPAAVQQILKREKAAGRIADLRGVTVFVAGATADRKLDRRKIQQIEAFWRAYFSMAGTELSDERYGASLLNFDLHQSAQ
jgi:hypothetical protein